MNKPFNLQTADFSDEQSDTNSKALQSPINYIMQKYNRQYSLIYQQIQTFLKQCKDNIFKYISLNQFGVGLNIGNIFSQIMKLQSIVLNDVSDGQKQQFQFKKNTKIKFEEIFSSIVDRMTVVIQDFLKFQIDFKRQYFGHQVKAQQAQSRYARRLQSPALTMLKRQKSLKSKSSSSSQPQKQQDDKQQIQIQQKLREILKRKLVPSRQNLIKFCNKQSQPIQNIAKLQQKLDMMQSEIILSRARQQKIIDIFNKRRIQNMQPKGQNLIHNELIVTNSGKQSILNNQHNNNMLDQQNFNGFTAETKKHLELRNSMNSPKNQKIFQGINELKQKNSFQYWKKENGRQKINNLAHNFSNQNLLLNPKSKLRKLMGNSPKNFKKNKKSPDSKVLYQQKIQEELERSIMENKNSMKEIKTDKNIEMLNKNRMNFMKIRIAGGEHGGQI